MNTQWTMSRFHRFVVVAMVCGFATVANAAAQPVFRISLENARDHVQVRVVQEFADELAARTVGRLRV